MWILGHKGLGTGSHRFGSCVAFPFFPVFFFFASSPEATVVEVNC